MKKQLLFTLLFCAFSSPCFTTYATSTTSLPYGVKAICDEDTDW
ncbi:MAG: hypothetical protein ACSLEL_01670 [Candidatus Malihini olakiniferum]